MHGPEEIVEAARGQLICEQHGIYAQNDVEETCYQAVKVGLGVLEALQPGPVAYFVVAAREREPRLVEE